MVPLTAGGLRKASHQTPLYKKNPIKIKHINLFFFFNIEALHPWVLRTSLYPLDLTLWTLLVSWPTTSVRVSLHISSSGRGMIKIGSYFLPPLINQIHLQGGTSSGKNKEKPLNMSGGRQEHPPGQRKVSLSFENLRVLYQ